MKQGLKLFIARLACVHVPKSKLNDFTEENFVAVVASVVAAFVDEALELSLKPPLLARTATLFPVVEESTEYPFRVKLRKTAQFRNAARNLILGIRQRFYVKIKM